MKSIKVRKSRKSLRKSRKSLRKSRRKSVKVRKSSLNKKDGMDYIKKGYKSVKNYIQRKRVPASSEVSLKSPTTPIFKNVSRIPYMFPNITDYLDNEDKKKLSTVDKELYKNNIIMYQDDYNVKDSKKFINKFIKLSDEKKDMWMNIWKERKHKISLKFNQYIPELLDVFSYFDEDLKSLITLNLSDCNQIRDVNVFSGVHNLDLSGCYRITDVSALGEVHTLNLSGCNNITDVSALGGVYNLDLSWCFGITDVSDLGGVHTLNLSGCQGITDVSMLCDVKELILTGCNNIVKKC